MGKNYRIDLDFAKKFNQSVEDSQKGREIKWILFLKYFPFQIYFKVINAKVGSGGG